MMDDSLENFILCSHGAQVTRLDSELLYKAINVVPWTTSRVTIYRDYNVNDIWSPVYTICLLIHGSPDEKLPEKGLERNENNFSCVSGMPSHS